MKHILDVQITNGYDWYHNRIGYVYSVVNNNDDDLTLYHLVEPFNVNENLKAVGIRKVDCIIIHQFKEDIDRILEI